MTRKLGSWPLISKTTRSYLGLASGCVAHRIATTVCGDAVCWAETELVVMAPESIRRATKKIPTLKCFIILVIYSTPFCLNNGTVRVLLADLSDTTLPSFLRGTTGQFTPETPLP